jgi:hypothetical protein
MRIPVQSESVIRNHDAVHLFDPLIRATGFLHPLNFGISKGHCMLQCMFTQCSVIGQGSFPCWTWCFAQCHGFRLKI